MRPVLLKDIKKPEKGVIYLATDMNEIDSRFKDKTVRVNKQKEGYYVYWA